LNYWYILDITIVDEITKVRELSTAGRASYQNSAHERMMGGDSMENEKIFELMTKMYADLKGSQEAMYADLKGNQETMYADLKGSQEAMYADQKRSQETMYADLKGSQETMYIEMQEGFKNVNVRLSFLEKTVMKIENNHGKKLAALFDGYMLDSEKLDRIEAEVAKHDEYILKRLK
jgi:hypothetical protein